MFCDVLLLYIVYKPNYGIHTNTHTHTFITFIRRTTSLLVTVRQSGGTFVHLDVAAADVKVYIYYYFVTNTCVCMCVLANIYRQARNGILQLFIIIFIIITYYFVL